ncbi:hypothetical protein L9F63_013149, partial [Diploptera punctata]
GVEDLHNYSDKVAQMLNNSNADREVREIQEAIHELYDAHVTNWLTRLMMADSNATKKFIASALDIFENGCDRKNRPDMKKTFEKLFYGNAEATKRALEKMIKMIFSPKEITSDVLQVAILFHKFLFMKTDLLPCLVNVLMTDVENAEKITRKRSI